MIRLALLPLWTADQRAATILLARLLVLLLVWTAAGVALFAWWVLA